MKIVYAERIGDTFNNFEVPCRYGFLLMDDSPLIVGSGLCQTCFRCISCSDTQVDCKDRGIDSSGKK